MELAVVIPLLNERESLLMLYEQLVAVLEPLARSYELIFIDDGSTDGSYDVLQQLHARDSRVKVLQFRRNYGKSAALAAGFAEATGEVIITMDADLQDDPAEIPSLLSVLGQGYDMVSGWKLPRRDPISKRLPSTVFNVAVRLLTGVTLHDFNCGLKAYRRGVVKDLVLYGELHRYIPVLVHWCGFSVREVQIHHRPRQFGKSKFGASRFVRSFFDLLTIVFLTQYAVRPLHLFGWPGIGSLAAGVAISLHMAVLWLMGERPIGTRPLFMLGVLLIIVGVQFFCFGLLAEMLVRWQTRDDPIYRFRKVLK